MIASSRVSIKRLARTNTCDKIRAGYTWIMPVRQLLVTWDFGFHQINFVVQWHLLGSHCLSLSVFLSFIAFPGSIHVIGNNLVNNIFSKFLALKVQLSWLFLGQLQIRINIKCIIILGELWNTQLTYIQIFIPIFKSFVPSFKSFIPRYKWFEDRYKWFVPREKGRDLTRSYDKSPYTNRNVIRAKWQHKQRHKKVQLHSGCGLN